MKIGILTLPLHSNYGGILQAYALQTVLERMGHDVFFIEKDRKIRNPSICRIAKRVVKKFFLRKKIEVFLEKKQNREQPIVCSNTWKFVDRKIKFFRSPQNMRNIPKDSFDAIVVGSDQIWRRIYFTSMVDSDYRNAFLRFASRWSCKKIAYAASFGVDEWQSSLEETREIKDLLERFDAVSVRECDAVSLCKEKIGVAASFVLDPTMLLEKEEYEKLIDEHATEPCSGNMLCYFLDETEEKRKLKEKIAQERNLVPFNVNSYAEDPRKKLSERVQPPVEQWLRAFSESHFVLTDSFHACVFSILFKKPFVAVGNKQRGLSRFQSLLGTLALLDHLIMSTDGYDGSKSYEISERSYILMEKLKCESMFFLERALNATKM